MHHMIRIVYLLLRKISRVIGMNMDSFRSALVFKGNGVTHSSFRTQGVPFVMVPRKGGIISIGKNFSMNNGIKGNPIGCYERCTFFVDEGAEIVIGDNVGISQTALISNCSIRIGNNVKIGGGTSVYTTDFHSLDAALRRIPSQDRGNRKNAPVVICDDVFIGAQSIILKGVTIGERSVVGAGSVVTKSIPAGQIWAGNPARFIREV